MHALALTLAQYDYYDDHGPVETIAGIVFGIFGLIFLAAFILTIVGKAMVFKKAGEPPWAAIIPLYNRYITFRIVGRPWWWLLAWLVPPVNWVVLLLAHIDLAHAFGKGDGFGIGLTLLPFVFFPMLGFGPAQYSRALLPADRFTGVEAS